MSENRSLFLKNDASLSGEVDKFLEGIKAGNGRGRLIFALDGTASRQKTWDFAAGLQAEMFREAASIGGLDLQLVYYRGIDECRASGWTSDPASLARTMSALDCRAGHTQIGRVLIHAKNEATKQPVGALVFVGDAIEEAIAPLCSAARALGQLKMPVFMFQEGRDPEVETAFRAIAKHSDGAYGRFDLGSARQLAELLRAVAAFAVGGLVALEGRKGSASLSLLGQIKRGD
jgi:hypothetical protein